MTDIKGTELAKGDFVIFLHREDSASILRYGFVSYTDDIYYIDEDGIEQVKIAPQPEDIFGISFYQVVEEQRELLRKKRDMRM